MEKNGRRRVVMISLDAVGKRDMEYLLQKPNFKKINLKIFAICTY